jgi:hypothetical protein
MLRLDCGRDIFLSKPYRAGTTKSKHRRLLNGEVTHLTSGAAAVTLTIKYVLKTTRRGKKFVWFIAFSGQPI